MTANLYQAPTTYRGRRLTPDVMRIASALARSSCPAAYDLRLRASIAPWIAVAHPCIDLHRQLEGALPGIIGWLMPIDSREQSELEAQWPACTKLAEEMASDGPRLPLREFDTMHVYAAFADAAREVFPDRRQLPQMFGVTRAVFALTHRVALVEMMPLWQLVEAAKAASTLPEEWRHMLWERAAELGFWQAFTVVERIRHHLGA